ncbi:MAG: hypothetical protein ACKVZ6_10825 [Kineosporiaceae bacterium]
MNSSEKGRQCHGITQQLPSPPSAARCDVMAARVALLVLLCAAFSAITTALTLAVSDAGGRWVMIVFTIETAVLFATSAGVAMLRR